MKKFIDKCKEWLFEKSIFLWILIIEIIILAGIIILFGDDMYIWLGLHAPDEQAEQSAQFYRNRGFFAFAIFGFILTATGIILTFWGRVQTEEQTKQTQKQIKLSREANASERYENAAKMLGDPVLSVRTAGCHALMSLGTKNDDMAIQCIKLLLHFISAPYLDAEEKNKTNSLPDEEKLKKLFPNEKPLRLDIQAAVKGFSDIFNYDYEEYVDLFIGAVSLPSYFWENNEKGKISLPNSVIYGELNSAYLYGANFQGANLSLISLREVNLREANLEDVNFWATDLSKANLQNANLKKAELLNARLSGAKLNGADLSEAEMYDTDLSEADMRKVKNLTKEQVLSATWGLYPTSEECLSGPPDLPEELLEYEDIQIWLKEPHYNILKDMAEEEKEARWRDG